MNTELLQKEKTISWIILDEGLLEEKTWGMTN